MKQLTKVMRLKGRLVEIYTALSKYFIGQTVEYKASYILRTIM